MQRVKKQNLKAIYITGDTILDVAFILYFCIPFGQLFLKWLGISSSTGACIAAVPVYGLLLISAVMKKPADAIADFWLLFGCVLLLFGITYLLNPAYRYWYSRETYGFWDCVFRPDNGIYAYLFIRTMKSPERILRNMRISGWIMYIYYGRWLLSALRRGYWENTNNQGAIVHASYNLSFGYGVLLFTLVFLYTAMRSRKKVDIAGSLIGIAMILLGGSRGPLLCIAVFLLLMGAVYLKKSKNKVVVLSLIAVVVGCGFFFGDILIALLQEIMSKMNISSRTINMLLEGTVSDDNGRDVIWQAAIQMIKSNPLGYGPMGSRHVIVQYHIAGHCHNIALEMMVDFGVVPACLILLFLLKNAISIILNDRYQKWRGLFMIFFAASCELLISSCYWTLNAFWGAIAIGCMAIMSARSRKRRALGARNLKLGRKRGIG